MPSVLPILFILSNASIRLMLPMLAALRVTYIRSTNPAGWGTFPHSNAFGASDAFDAFKTFSDVNACHTFNAYNSSKNTTASTAFMIPTGWGPFPHRELQKKLSSPQRKPQRKLLSAAEAKLRQERYSTRTPTRTPYPPPPRRQTICIPFLGNSTIAYVN